MNACNLLLTVVIFCLVACGQATRQNQVGDSVLIDTPQAISTQQTPLAPGEDCTAGEKLVYRSETFASYTEDKMRGKGVVSFRLDINDRLDIYYQDNAVFGYLVLNEDMTYYLLNMPKRLLARKVVPEFDFASFSFDADGMQSDPEYLFIYANKERLKVKKADVSYIYQTWDDYLKSEPVSLKPCNLLENTSTQSRDLLFDVLEVKGDEIKIRSSKTCGGEDASYSDLEGWVKWRNRGTLLVDLASCN